MRHTKEQIESIFLKTMSGIYLYSCGKNSDDAMSFYKNQLDTFTHGFECCEKIKDIQK